MVHEHPVEVLHLLVSPVHRYVGRPRAGPADLPPGSAPESRRQVQVLAGQGIAGDRYCGRAAHRTAAVSLLDVSALETVARELGVAPFDPMVLRRNVVLRGVDVTRLREQEFSLDSGSGPVVLGGRRLAQPCGWLDVVLAPGAHGALRGRGGLRCEPLGSGVLQVGPAVLRAPHPLG